MKRITHLTRIFLPMLLASVQLLTACGPAAAPPSDTDEKTTAAVTSDNGDTTEAETVPDPFEPATMQALDMTAIKPITVKKLDTSPDSRRVVNTENPMFLFRSYLGVENMLTLWNMLPEDIREYSVIHLDYDQTKPIAEVLPAIEEMLTVADREGIPVMWQIENWDSVSTREGFTESQLLDYLDAHPSVIGFAHTEMSCGTCEPEELARMKTTLRACQQRGALFVWLDMEYAGNRNVFARFMEDEEFHNMLSAYSHNVVLMDKHNGQGRHFAVQSAAMGMWLSDVCGNWGSNVESWLWYEEGFGQYDDAGGTHRSYPWYFIRQYPAAMFGIDTLNDAVGGATVFSFEEGVMTLQNEAGETVFTPGFYNICYPIYQKMVSGGLIPTKEQVKEKVKVAFQYTDIDADIVDADAAEGFEASLFVDLYGPTRKSLNLYKPLRVSKKWLPTTGRYYIVPSLSKYVDAAKLLPDAAIITAENAAELRNSKKKLEFFDERYAEFYKGTATMYDMGGYSLLFNNHENITVDALQDAAFTLDSGKSMNVTLPEHTYVMLYDQGNTLELELYNYRYDARAMLSDKETMDAFHYAYIKGERDSNELDFRTVTFSVEGLTAAPRITAEGNNNASITTEWDADSGVLHVTVTMNGVVKLQIQGMN